MILAFAFKLDPKVWHTNMRAPKIDDNTFETFEMTLTSFWVKDKLSRSWFFQKLFLLANISVKMVLEILFLTFNNTDILFIQKILIWKSYTTIQTLRTTKWKEFLNKKEFAKAVLDEKSEIFVMHITVLEILLLIIIIYFF